MEDFLLGVWETIVALFRFLYHNLFENGFLLKLYDWGCEHPIWAAVLILAVAAAAFWSAKIAKNLGIILVSLLVGYCTILAYLEPHDEALNIFIIAFLVASGVGVFIGIYRLKRMF